MTPEAFLAAHPIGLAAHARIVELLAPLGRTDIRVTKSQVAYRRRRGLAWLWLPGTWLRNPAADVVLSIALPREAASARWKQVVHPGTHVWMHHLELHAAADIDDEVAAWLAEAWRAAGAVVP